MSTAPQQFGTYPRQQPTAYDASGLPAYAAPAAPINVTVQQHTEVGTGYGAKRQSAVVHAILLCLTGGIGNVVYAWKIHKHNDRLGRTRAHRR